MTGDLIWLVRHGQSTANAGEPARDYPSIPLSHLGELQARAFVARVPRPPDRIVHSSFVRSRQTALPLLEANPQAESLERPVHEFSYLWFPGDRPITWQERVPLVDAYWDRLDPHHREAGRGETYAELVERVHGFLTEAAGWRGFSVVFSHEQFMRGVALAVLTGRLTPTADSMRQFVVWRRGWPVPNVACLALRNLHGQWWVAGSESG
ncbi:MAG: histidine phosphatase family protein [Planctomycetaceae bacterium]|jgi:probable phosphoglycerate mutase